MASAFGHRAEGPVTSGGSARNQPSCGPDVVVEHGRPFEGPGQCLGNRPVAGTLAVETEPVGEAIKSVGNGVAAGAEFAAADNGGDCELDLTSEGLGVDHQPRFTLGGHVEDHARMSVVDH